MAKKTAERRAADRSWRETDYDDDGRSHHTRRRLHERKTAQLCACASRALHPAIAGELRDDELEGLCLIEVRPHPDASHLLLVVSAPAGTDPEAAESSLLRVRGRLRLLLGHAIARKRVPLLSFAVLSAEVSLPGGTADER